MTEKTTRRDFLMTGAAAAGGIVGTAALQQNLTSFAKPAVQNSTDTAKTTATIPERALGRTGIKVPIFGLGEQVKRRYPGMEQRLML